MHDMRQCVTPVMFVYLQGGLGLQLLFMEIQSNDHLLQCSHIWRKRTSDAVLDRLQETGNEKQYVCTDGTTLASSHFACY